MDEPTSTISSGNGNGSGNGSAAYRESDLSGQWFEFTQSLRKRWGLIRAVTLSVTAVVVLGTWVQRPVYRATASVFIDMETPSVLAVSASRDDATVSQMNFFAYADYYRTQLEVMSSRDIAERVFKNLKLGERKEFKHAEDPIWKLMSFIEIEPVKQTRLAKVHVEHNDPKLAAQIANELAIVYTFENLTRASSAEAMILAKTEYMELQRKEAELSKRYKNRHPAIVRVRKEMEQLAKTIEGGVEPGGTSGEAIQLRPNNIRIQDVAQVPTHPVRPKRLLSLFLGLIFGLLAGTGIAVGMELVDTSFKTPDDLDIGSRVPLLGHIPRIDGVQGSPGREFEDHTRFAGVESFSPAAEAYRSIRTNLQFAAPVEKVRAIVFTSPGPGEGKTTTLSNLGAAIARGGQQVLLVDADMRRGRLHEIFRCRRSPGLSEVLAGKATLEQAVQKTDIPGLWVVSCGEYPPYPAEMLGSAQMRAFLQKTEGLYERVLVDSPPVMAVTDAAVLAGMIKTVIAVVQSGKTPQQALRQLQRTCQNVRANVLGAILNNVPVWSTPYYYRYSSYGYARRSTPQGQPEESPA